MRIKEIEFEELPVKDRIIFESSKLMELSFFLLPDELRECLCLFKDFIFVKIGKIDQPQSLVLDPDQYRASYENCFFDSCILDKPCAHIDLNMGLSSSSDSLIVKSWSENRAGFYIRKPILLWQAGFFKYQRDTHDILHNSYGEGSFWGGIKIVFPQLYTDNPSFIYQTVKEKSRNYQMFIELRQYLRRETSLFNPEIELGNKVKTTLRVSQKGKIHLTKLFLRSVEGDVYG